MGAEILQQGRRLTHINNDDFLVAVIIQITDGETSRRMFGRYTWTCKRGDIKKPAASQVPVKQPLLFKLFTRMSGIHRGIDMPGGYDNVFPSVIIDVQRLRSPSQIFGVNRQ